MRKLLRFVAFAFSGFAFVVLTTTVMILSHAHPAIAQTPAVPPLRVLLVLAHPDDETMIGSFLIRLHEIHADVRAIYATNGEAGRMYQQNSSGEAQLFQADAKVIKAIRERELNLATHAYGISNLLRLNFPDVPLRDPKTLVPSHDVKSFISSRIWDLENMSEEISETATQFQPQFIITMTLDADAHAHHKAIRTITQNLYTAGLLGRSVLGLYAISEEHWIKTGRQESRETWIGFDAHCGNYAARAAQAANFHQSQLPGHVGPIPENEVIYKISGLLSPFYQEALQPSVCHHTFHIQGE